ncbi:MAG: hypothetical protein NXI31_22355 [bacterium]|nr:hypothetical protein [bacterium]
MKSLRQFIIGLLSVLLGGDAAWRGMNEGPWFLVLGGVVLVGAGLDYCVRPGRRLLGLIELALGTQLLVNFFASGREFTLSGSENAGPSVIALLAGLLVIVGARNLLVSPPKPRSPAPADHPGVPD